MSTLTVASPLEPESVVAYLQGRGVLRPGPQAAHVSPQGGGVSGDVFLVETEDARVVVKTALAKLRVDRPWFATVERANTEAQALTTLHDLTPDNTPALLDVDPERHTLTMTAAPVGMAAWKERLLHGPIRVAGERADARRLGLVLRSWHDQTRARVDVAARFDDYEAFSQLRIDPFHRSVADRHPAVGPAIEACIGDLLGERSCFVHGDFSPKNVLVGSSEVIILDFEVAHFGAPVFDVAFLQTHLLLKGVHRPQYAAEMQAIAAGFMDGYGPLPATPSFKRLGWHVSALLLSRVDGTSPAGYLTEAEQQQVRTLALAYLRRPKATLPELWSAVTRTAP